MYKKRSMRIRWTVAIPQPLIAVGLTEEDPVPWEIPPRLMAYGNEGDRIISLSYGHVEELKIDIVELIEALESLKSKLLPYYR